MRVLRSVIVQTIRAALRSHVFHVLFGLVVLAVFALPLTVTGDGTARGHLQISLTYSLGIVTLLLSVSTLWLSCSQLAREIEAHQLHLLVVKPAPRWLIWAGKALGVFLLNAALFLFGSACIYGLVMWRVGQEDFGPEELERVRSEILVGRREFKPELPDFAALARDVYNKMLQDGRFEEGHSRREKINELHRQIRANFGEIPHGMQKFWVFRGLPTNLPPETRIFMRYRPYTGDTTDSSKRMFDGVWGLRDPYSKEGEQFVYLQQREMSGAFHELAFSAGAIDSDGVLVLQYINIDEEKEAAIFQAADGPTLLVPETGFLGNYCRAFLLGLFQLAFLSLLGCAASGAFSVPVAIFAGVSYIVIGMSVHGALAARMQIDELDLPSYTGKIDILTHYIALGVNRVVVSVNDFNVTSTELIRGRLITGGKIWRSFLDLLLLRSAVFVVLGVWFFSKRELGMVIRR